MSNTLSNRPETKNNRFIEMMKRKDRLIGVAAVVGALCLTPSCSSEAQPASPTTSNEMYVIPDSSLDTLTKINDAEFDAEAGLRFEREIGEGSIVQSLIDHVNEIDSTAFAGIDSQETALEANAQTIYNAYKEQYGGEIQPNTKVTIYENEAGVWCAELSTNQGDVIIE